MVEMPGDWKVWVIIDRKLLAKDINTLTRILTRERMAVTVSASNPDEAEEKARALLQRSLKTPACYVKALNTRRMPTGVS